MANGKRISIDMMKAACERNWTASKTAKYYGLHRKSVDAACERFGVVLPLHDAPFFGDYGVLQEAKVPKVRTTKKPSNAVWSCSEAAVKKALEKIGRA